MTSQQERIPTLWQLYLSDRASAEQVNELFTYLKDPANDAVIDAQFFEVIQESGVSASFAPGTGENGTYFESLLAARASLRDAWEKKESTVTPVAPVHRIHFLRRSWFRYAAAAVFACIGITAAVLLTSDRKPGKSNNAGLPVAKIVPGSHGAILTLADGSNVVLDSLKDGVIATQGNTAIKMKNGQLVYNAKTGGPVSYNSMTTPKGKHFRLMLPDGSQVWLNAASSITYPTIFSGAERKVAITGEAYFEIAKNASLPFIVSVAGKDTIEVLGTHFNINAYEDEGRISTTLLEGKVRVRSKTQTILQPGEQAISIPDLPLTLDRSPDLEQVMAWKTGIFYFRNASLPTVMRQLGRWYDIDIEYTGKIPVLKVSGKMDRGLSIQEILYFLEKMDVDCSMSGRRVIVHGH